MKKKKSTAAGKETGLVALTEKLYSEYEVSELEERLETDPLLLANLFDLDQARGCNCKNKDCKLCGCNNIQGCPEAQVCSINK
ncbi:MAG: hypothetical protein IJC16_04220 [Rikenellaceae bacterium]|nr:hypothetical protein [Rikenellaceae bacterium]